MSKKKKVGGFIADFKKFVTRGNVLDMAVAVIIGGAFGAIVTGLVQHIFNPVLYLLTGGSKSLDGLRTVLRPGAEAVKDPVTGEVTTEAVKEVAIEWGLWLQSIIGFLIIALFMFLVIRIITKMGEKIHAKELAEKKAADEIKKAEEKAAAEAAAAVAAEKEAKLQQFYDNVEKQTQLLEKIAKK